MAPIRIRSASTKAGILATGLVSGFLLTLLIGAVLGPDDGGLLAFVATALLVAVVIFCVRTFRGPGESNAPRPWWRLTARPLAAFVVAALFLVSALQNLLEPAGIGGGPVVTYAPALVQSALGLAFVISGVLQRSHR